MLAITGGSKEGHGHGWSMVLVDAEGHFARACSEALLLCGSSWVAKWCGKGLAVCVLCEWDMPPTAVMRFVADNLCATFGAHGAGPSHCMWVNTVRRKYAAFLEA